MSENDDNYLKNLKETENELIRINEHLKRGKQFRDKAKNIATGFIITCFGAWITSYLYERFQVDNKIDGVFQFVGSIPEITADTAVHRAVNSQNFPYFTLMCLVIFSFSTPFIIRDLYRKIKNREKLSLFSILWNLWTSIGSIYCIFFLAICSYAYVTLIPYTENRIEILSPYISDQEYKELKSEYYSINKNSQMLKFRSKLTKNETEYGLKSRY
nr:MAG TPA: hypothetical protein [Caudoviricetes sp.]